MTTAGDRVEGGTEATEGLGFSSICNALEEPNGNRVDLVAFKAVDMLLETQDVVDTLVPVEE